jgi:hypothetical protein
MVVSKVAEEQNNCSVEDEKRQPSREKIFLCGIGRSRWIVMGEGIQNGSHALRRNQLDLGTYLYSKSFAFVKKWSESLEAFTQKRSASLQFFLI